MKGNNFFHANKVGIAIAPVSIASGAATAVVISEPWKLGEQLTFILQGGAFAAGATATCVVQGLLRSDGSTWEAHKNAVGTDIAFAPAKLAKGGALENGVLIGTIPVIDLDSSKYKAIRLLFTAGTANAQLIGASYVISELRRVPSVMADELFAIAHAPAQ